MRIKKFILILCTINIATNSLSQQDILEGWTYIQIDSTKQMWGDWNEPNWLRYFGLDAGDVNNDGNLDIISGRYVYHNPGKGMEGHWKRTVLDDNVDAILYLDVDGDPYGDIIAMALPNLYWYEALNTEGTKYKKRLIGKVPATSHVNSQGFEKADLVATGRSEFVIAGNGNIYAISIPEANADTVNWEVHMICENTSDEGIGVGDIDGDGDLDIAAGRRPDGEDEPKILVWYENPGSIETLWEEIIVGRSEHPIDRVEVADLNGDGKTDIVVTEERYPGLEPDANFWWFSQEDLSNWERHRIVTQFSINNLDITDLDRDGDIDLLTAEHKGENLELQLWKNDGKGNFRKTVIDTGKENHLGTQFVDLDNDGDLDIIGSGWDQHKYMHVWRNDAVKSLKSGMLFKEYPWVPEMVGDRGKFLRVGGKLDYASNADHFPEDGHKDGFIPLNQELDLENAISAEVIVERVQSHEDTKDLKIQFNNGKPLRLPEPGTIPNPPTDYMFHANVRASIPLSDLRQGLDNHFKLTVAKEQSWDWPQNLVYGIVLRVYYSSDEKKNPIAKISGIRSNEVLGNNVILSLAGEQLGEITSVDYIGHFEDVNVQGDGRYRQWQYKHYRGKLGKSIGSSSKAPFEVVWNTEWIPDQNGPLTVTALVGDNKGFTHVLPFIENLSLKREHSVLLAKPYAQEPFWTTRDGEHSQLFDIPFQTSKDDNVELYWTSWSPCYSEGMEVNGIVQENNADLPCYDAYWHTEKLKNMTSLKRGENRLKTLKTPLHNGKMVHGMEVQWPGIMVKVRREIPLKNAIAISEGIYENRPHFIIHGKGATYYFDKAGGGFSRILDSYGNDWVSYKTEPWDQYPASAASAFRGLPNLVFKSENDKGAGHPGHDKCVSEIVSENKIRTRTKSGFWEWEWTFSEDHAVLEVLSTDGTPYWFLYEGTPGGSFSPEVSTYGTDRSGPSSQIPDFYKGDIDFNNFRWAYFNKKGLDTTFFVAQINADGHTDMMSYLGNTSEGAKSKDGMTVFGFGRGENTTPLLKGKNSFIIGMQNFAVTDERNHQKIAEYINKLIKDHNH
ncbi:VCBS repeat-containing protein [Ulvibacterium sp.]|uniref:FG-GAP repeat domain-containing protein n=1 Tax=Ulvibacterium sp. TaxID=2665914 RepID=UPI0026175470|nr:VCBS repeat-containing protein [Ulvibacterium sp.]